MTGGIQLYDMFEQTKHNEIIMTPPTQEAVELNVFLLDKQANDFQGYNAEIQVDVKTEIKIVFMLRFVMQLAAYFQKEKEDIDVQQQIDTAFNERKQMSDESDNKNMVQEIVPSLTRIQVNVKVPVITVPLNDVSEDCLVVDLGTLEINSNYYVGSPDKDYE